MDETLLNNKNKEYGSTNTESEISDDEADEIELELDEVYEKIGRGPAQYIYWTVTGLLSIADQAEIGIISVILPSLRCQWNLTPGFETAITMSIFVSYAIFTVAFGKIADKVGRKAVLVWSVSALLLASVASAFAPDKWVFLIARSVAGACIGMNMNIIICYATEFSESKDRLIGMIVFGVVSSISYAFVNFLAWLILNAAGWRWLIIAISSPMVPAIALIIFMPGSPRYLLVSGQQDAAIRATKFNAQLNKRSLPSDFRLAPLNNESRGSYSAIFGSEHRRSVVTLSVQYFCNIFIGFGFILYQPLIFASGCTLGPTEQPARPCSLSNLELLKLALSSMFSVVANVLAPLSAYVLERSIALRISSFFMVLATTALFFCFTPAITFSIATAMNFIGSFINGYLWLIYPEAFPTNIRTTAIGFINGCGKVGAVLGTGSVSVFYYMNPTIVAGLFLTASIVGFAMSLIYNKKTKDVEMTDT